MNETNTGEDGWPEKFKLFAFEERTRIVAKFISDLMLHRHAEYDEPSRGAEAMLFDTDISGAGYYEDEL